MKADEETIQLWLRRMEYLDLDEVLHDLLRSDIGAEVARELNGDWVDDPDEDDDAVDHVVHVMD